MRGTPEARKLQEKDGRFFAQKDAQERCTFLSPNNQCQLHQRAKPSGCRQFPFRLTRTPDGIFVGASFYCPSIQANEGQPLPAFQAELENLAEHLPLWGDKGLPVWGDCRLDWADYRRLEADILAQASAPQGVARGLWALAQFSLNPRRPLAAYLERAGEALEPPDEPLILMEHYWFEKLMRQLEQKPERLHGHPPEPPLERYLRALVERKTLINRRPLLGNLALMHLIPRFYKHWWARLGSAEAAIQECEHKIITHPNNLDDQVARMGDDFRELDPMS